MEPTMLLWGLGLLAVAVILLVIDVFVPSFGILSITSLMVALAGVACLFAYDTVWGVIGSLLVVVGGPIMAFVGLQIMPNTPIGRKLVLRNPSEGDEGDRPLPGIPSGNELFALVGREGVVRSDLRPVGSIEIAGERFEAISESGMVKAGTPVRVSSIGDGLQIKVRTIA